MCTLMACVCNEVLWREFLSPKLTHIFLINYAIEMLWNNIVSIVFHVFIKLLCVAIGKFGEHLTEELQLLSAVLWEMLLHLLLPSNFPWASNLSQSNNFYVIRIIIVDVLGGTGFGHQGWINYVFKILVCEVWNTLTLKKIVWVSGKWMFFLSETEYLLSENCDFNKMKFLYFMEIYKNCNWVLIKNSCCVSVKVFYLQKILISQCGCLW